MESCFSPEPSSGAAMLWLGCGGERHGRSCRQNRLAKRGYDKTQVLWNSSQPQKTGLSWKGKLDKDWAKDCCLPGQPREATDSLNKGSGQRKEKHLDQTTGP